MIFTSPSVEVRSAWDILDANGESAAAEEEVVAELESTNWKPEAWTAWWERETNSGKAADGRETNSGKAADGMGGGKDQGGTTGAPSSVGSAGPPAGGVSGGAGAPGAPSSVGSAGRPAGGVSGGAGAPAGATQRGAAAGANAAASAVAEGSSSSSSTGGGQRKSNAKREKKELQKLAKVATQIAAAGLLGHENEDQLRQFRSSEKVEFSSDSVRAPDQGNKRRNLVLEYLRAADSEADLVGAEAFFAVAADVNSDSAPGNIVAATAKNVAEKLVRISSLGASAKKAATKAELTKNLLGEVRGEHLLRPPAHVSSEPQHLIPTT